MPLKTSFYITTPIYYSNGVPHVGHAYSSFIADIFFRYYQYNGIDSKFTTGVDENSQKVVDSAAKLGMSTTDYAQMMAEKHKDVWDGIDIKYTNFIRTTGDQHKKYVQEILQKSYENGDIYKGKYSGLYCVGCEAFKKESDLDNGECPDHPGKPVSQIEEENYFFKLSKYEDRLLKFYEENPEWIQPKNRYNEIIEFVKGGLEDFSVSREGNTVGIPLPFDSDHVTYVWYDALFSYLTACQDDESKWWPADIHVIGKDIIRFHGIFWPAMLWSAGYELPRKILTTGHFTLDGQKISKSIGNVIDPVEYCQEYSRDALLLYLLTAFPVGEDGDFDRKQALLTYNAKLANNLGNLLSRCNALSLKIGGKIHKKQEVNTNIGKGNFEIYQTSMQDYKIKNALDTVFGYTDELNKYLDETAPWKIDIETQKEEFEQVLYTVLFHLRKIALMLLPFFTQKMESLLERIGTPLDTHTPISTQIEYIPEYFEFGEKYPPLYERIDIHD
ncbi:methionine--tRNA ligase [Candidatus Gracilibacteria bacterium]|nr:MAG: methionine--tRNA ligase [Candidatus Gracilibacteria bacterium]